MCFSDLYYFLFHYEANNLGLNTNLRDASLKVGNPVLWLGCKFWIQIRRCLVTTTRLGNAIKFLLVAPSYDPDRVRF